MTSGIPLGIHAGPLPTGLKRRLARCFRTSEGSRKSRQTTRPARPGMEPVTTTRQLASRPNSSAACDHRIRGVKSSQVIVASSLAIAWMSPKLARGMPSGRSFARNSALTPTVTVAPSSTNSLESRPTIFAVSGRAAVSGGSPQSPAHCHVCGGGSRRVPRGTRTLGGSCSRSRKHRTVSGQRNPACSR
jgi:hypothetical protein